MLSKNFLEELSQKAAELFPAAKEVREDIESRMHSLLQQSFSKLNLVSREEFDAQLAVLKRAEETISTLETKVSELESKLGT